MDENTFEGFKWHLLLSLSTFGWTKIFLKPSHSIAIHFQRFRMNKDTFDIFAFYLISTLCLFGSTKTILKPLHAIYDRFKAFSGETKHVLSLCILFTLRELIFTGTKFCGSQFRDFLRELNFADFSLERKLEPFCELFDLCFSYLKIFTGTKFCGLDPNPQKPQKLVPAKISSLKVFSI